jgi:hypothetical protein
MTTHVIRPTRAQGTDAEAALMRVSACFGIAFTCAQLAVMVAMGVFVLPHVAGPGDPALERGRDILDVQTAYRVSNYAFMAAGTLLLGFLGAVQARLRRVDPSGVLATVALVAGTMLALVWPLAGVLHDVAMEATADGGDVRLLAGWDSVAPYSLAFSVFPRLFFVGAMVVALRLAGSARWLQLVGLVLLPTSLLGSTTLLTDTFFPVLALSTLAYELWVGAVAWHWLRTSHS